MSEIQEETLIENSSKGNRSEPKTSHKSDKTDQFPKRTNILIENDFTFIDDDDDVVENEENSLPTKQKSTNSVALRMEDATEILNFETKDNWNNKNVSKNCKEQLAVTDKNPEISDNHQGLRNYNNNHHADAEIYSGDDVQLNINTNSAISSLSPQNYIYQNCAINSSCSKNNETVSKTPYELADLEEDPYIELQEYIEKVKREINDAFEEYNMKSNSITNTDYAKRTSTLPTKITARKLLKNDHYSATAYKKKRNSYDEIEELKRRVEPNPDPNSTIESKDVNVWASKVIRELDNLVGFSREAGKEKKNHDTLIVRPEKHATIPLQSFNIDDAETLRQITARRDSTTKSIVTKNIILQNNAQSLNRIETVLKIEEDPKEIKSKSTINHSPIAMKLKKDKYLQSLTTSPVSGCFSKKGSTSTIWTSEESILRNTSTFDEDAKSISSCEDTSVLLSSGKSGNSLDSSELDNEQPESGIGTATPPKELNSKIMSQELNLNKNMSVQSCDEPDLLEVLSLYDENENENETDDAIDLKFGHMDCIDGGQDHEVVFRKKRQDFKTHEKHRHAISMPFSRCLKTRSHFIEHPKLNLTSSNIELKYTRSKDFIENTDSSQLDNFDEDNISSNIQELPALSSASLHSGNENVAIRMIVLTAKSNSAPILIKNLNKREDINFNDNETVLRYSRSQSDRYLVEIEAGEACQWLRAAGFPQYAQMYEDSQFPIDLSYVARDHPILENDPLQSLYRRLCILNRAASLRLDTSHRQHQQPQKEDSDDEGVALSDNWTFQPQSRRWSRIGEMGLDLPSKSQDQTDGSSKESSPERGDEDCSGRNSDFLTLPLNSSDSSKTDTDSMRRLRRTGSERLKDGAKAFMRRVESIKSRRRKRQNRDGFVLSGGSNCNSSMQPVLNIPNIDHGNSSSKIDKSSINIVFSTPPSPSAVSPIHFYPRTVIGNELKVPSENSSIFLHPNRSSPKHIPTTPRSCHSMRASPLHFFANPMPNLREGKSDDSSSYFSDSQESSTGDKILSTKKKLSIRSRRFLQRSGKVDDVGAHSDSECHAGAGRKFIIKDAIVNTEEEVKTKKLTRGGSLNLGKESNKYRETFRNRSFRAGGSSSKKSSKDGEGHNKKKTPVVRWHSFQNHEKPALIFKKCFTENAEPKEDLGISFAAMSCGQLQVVRKLALVTLTGYMERYCPSHRTGWNWELPKFIKKIKTPDYKDKIVFGVPLLLFLQRSGKCLPVGITAAIRWLQLNALDQVGIFRKSGVKSRILKLKETVELLKLYEDCMDMFDSQQAYDVADMLKQYFRELPDSLLTAKMSETFVAIFQHLPPDIRIDAVQSAILLLPDENRVVLYALLSFLNEVASKSQLNQMTASNLAVCLAPSLFNSSIATGNPVAVSPRRRKAASGTPSLKELSETKASHECLALMISQYKQMFTANHEKVVKCNFGYMEESNPVSLESLGDGMAFQNWKGYLMECTNATIREGREKSRGWIATSSLDNNIDIAYKKVGDGHLLRLWRCLTEVEGPPADVLNFILNERNIWDSNLLKSQLIKQLDDRSEIVQYLVDGQIPTDFCVLRSWQVELPNQACVIVETSIKHPDAKPMVGSIRGVILASRYLIEPCGSGRSRVMHLSRIDLKGKTPEWYNKNYGHICSQYLSKIRTVFRHVAEGPESKV